MWVSRETARGFCFLATEESKRPSEGIVRSRRLASAIVHPSLLSRRRQRSFTRQSRGVLLGGPGKGAIAAATGGPGRRDKLP